MTIDISVRPARLARPAMSLLAGISISVLTSSMALAANYTASNSSELIAAINQANADGAAHSTITLTGPVTMTGSTWPAVTKNLTITATDSAILSSSGPTTIEVGSGIDLTIAGPVRITGNLYTPSAGGRLAKTGAGTLTFSGGNSTYDWWSIAEEGDIVYKDGAIVSFDGNTGPNGGGVPDSSSTSRSRMIVSGDGTVVTIRGGGHFGEAGGATLIIEDGGEVVSLTALNLGGDVDESGTLRVDGAGSKLTGGISTLRGQTTIEITNGGAIEGANMSIGGTWNANAILSRDFAGGTDMLVSGVGSRIDLTGNMLVRRGAVDILDGGSVSAARLVLGEARDDKNAVLRMLVSGEGSQMLVSGTTTNSFLLGGANDSNTGTGRAELIIADGGRVQAGADSTGTIVVATGTRSRGVISIGGGEGEASAAAGTLEAGLIQFGTGESVISFNHTDALYLFDIAIASGTGTGIINHTGSGHTRLTANQTGFTGTSNIYDGIFEVNGVLGGTVNVLGGRLQGIGTVGATRNAAGGTIAPGNSIGTLTIDGDYLSDGGRLEIEAVLGGDLSPTDLLVITGDSLLGLAPTLIDVINLGGLGDVTSDGIKIVDVQGGTSETDVFVMGRPAIAGAYVYELFQGTPTVADGDWYLRNTELLAPTTPTLENYPIALLGSIDLPTMRQRIGERRGGDDGMWGRMEGAFGHHEAGSSTTGASYDSSQFLAQFGLDLPIHAGPDGMLVGALTAQYGRSAATVLSSFGNGGNVTESFGVGATLTWTGTDGTYVDLQGQLAGFASDLDAAGYALVKGNGGAGYALSAEVGHSFQLDDEWEVTPQAQLRYSSVRFDSFTDSFGSDVSLKNGASLVGRLGLSVDYRSASQDDQGREETHMLYAVGNLTYEFLDGARVQVSGTDLGFSGQKLGAELGLGGQIEWADGARALHGEVLASTSFAGSHAARGTVGFTGKF